MFAAMVLDAQSNSQAELVSTNDAVFFQSARLLLQYDVEFAGKQYVAFADVLETSRISKSNTSNIVGCLVKTSSDGDVWKSSKTALHRKYVTVVKPAADLTPPEIRGTGHELDTPPPAI